MSILQCGKHLRTRQQHHPLPERERIRERDLSARRYFFSAAPQNFECLAPQAALGAKDPLPALRADLSLTGRGRLELLLYYLGNRALDCHPERNGVELSGRGRGIAAKRFVRAGKGVTLW
jgi:hypothetical protein